jgi:hypothetical protein
MSAACRLQPPIVCSTSFRSPFAAASRAALPTRRNPSLSRGTLSTWAATAGVQIRCARNVTKSSIIQLVVVVAVVAGGDQDHGITVIVRNPDDMAGKANPRAAVAQMRVQFQKNPKLRDVFNKILQNGPGGKGKTIDDILWGNAGQNVVFYLKAYGMSLTYYPVGSRNVRGILSNPQDLGYWVQGYVDWSLNP